MYESMISIKDAVGATLYVISQRIVGEDTVQSFNSFGQWHSIIHGPMLQPVLEGAA